MTKIELVRSIIPQPPSGAKINLTMKVSESYILIDSIDVIDVGTIRSVAMVHHIDLIDRVV